MRLGPRMFRSFSLPHSTPQRWGCSRDFKLQVLRAMVNLSSFEVCPGEAQIRVLHIKCYLVKMLRGLAHTLCWSDCYSAKKEPLDEAWQNWIAQQTPPYPPAPHQSLQLPTGTGAIVQEAHLVKSIRMKFQSANLCFLNFSLAICSYLEASQDKTEDQRDTGFWLCFFFFLSLFRLKKKKVEEEKWVCILLPGSRHKKRVFCTWKKV